MATSTKIEISAVDKTQRAFSSVKTSLGKLGDAVTSTKTAVAGLVAGFAANEFTGFLDTATRIENKLKLVTDSSNELAKAQNEVYRVAQTTGAGLEQTADLYSKIVSSTEALNLSSKDQITITEAVSKAIAISGTTAEGAAGAITQLGQALGSGALRGEEFNSVNEQAPRIMQALADSLGVTRGDLKKLASDGVLTAEIVTEALLLQSDTIDAEYGKTTTTVAESFTKLKNSAVVFFGVLDDNTGISTLFSDALARMAKGLGKVTDAIKPATVQSLSKEINDLSTAQRDELLALDKLVTENGNLNVMQENQARIMRLNIAERGEKIKKLRAELDGINEVAAAQKEETKETGKATSASKLTADQLARRKKLREQLNKLTGGTLELSKDEIKNQTKIYEIGQKNSLVTGEVSEANQAYFESMKGYLTVAEEMQATELQKKIFLQAHADLMEEQKQKQQEQLDLENKIYAVGQKNSLITGETSEANQAYFESMKGHLTVVEEVTATELQKKLFLKAHAELMEEANRKKQRQLEIENEIYAVGQKNSLVTGEASQSSQDFFKSVNDRLAVEKESEALAQQQLEIAKGIFLTNMEQGKYTEQQATELATQLGLVEQMEALQQVLNDKKKAEAEIESDLNFFLDERAKKQSTFNKLLDGAKKKFGEINSAAKSSAGALADNSVFQGVTGAAGASGARAMSIAKATAKGGWQAGVMQLVLSNKKVQEALGKVFDALFKLIDPLIDLLVPALDALTPAIEELKPVFEAMKPYFAVFGAALKTQAVAIGQFFKGFAELVKVFESNTKFVRDFGKELEKVGPRIEQLGHKLEEFGQGLLDGVKTIGETLLTGIKEFIEGMGTELLNLPGNLATGIVDGLADLPEDLTTGIASGLTDFPGDITDGIEDGLAGYMDFMQKTIDSLSNIFGDITEGAFNFVDFVVEKIESVIDFAGSIDLVGMLTDAVSGLFDAIVPSGSIPLLPNPFHPFGLGPANLLEYEFAQGGYLRGPSHAQGGMPALVGGRRPVELEGGEFIIRKSAVQSLGLKALYALNSATNSKRGQQVRDAMGIKEFGAGGLAGGSWVKPFRKSELGLSLRDLGDVGNKIADVIGNHGVEFGLEFPDKSSAKIFGVGGLISEGTKSGNLGKEFINEGNDILGRIKASFDAGIFPPSLSMSASYDPPWSSLWPFASGGPVPVIQNGAARGGSYSSAPPVIEVSIYDGTGQRISEYDSALRVEIKERAARNSQFAAVA